MKTVKLLALIVCAILFSECKTSTEATQTPASVLEVHQILNLAQQKFLQYADTTSGNPLQAIDLTAEWLQTQPNVKSAVTLDSRHIDIELKSGLKTAFYFNEVDDNGKSIFRGGGDGSGETVLSVTKTRSKNTITNNKVLLFLTDTTTLPETIKHLPTTLKQINNSGLGLDVTVLFESQCSYGVVEHFGDYGFVLINGHGLIDGFYVGSTLDLPATTGSEDALSSAVTSQTGAGTYSNLANGNLQLVASVSANPNKPAWQKSVIPSTGRGMLFTSQYMNLLPPMPNTVIFGNMCNSGFRITTLDRPARTDTLANGQIKQISAIHRTFDPIGLAFTNRNLISYYGYSKDVPVAGNSASVRDDFAGAMEDTLIKRLFGDDDSTKQLNLTSNFTSELFDAPDPGHGYDVNYNLYFRHWGADDYSYPQCGDSITDSRDGQKYATVCIGKHVWMAQNLNYNAPGSLVYDNDPANGLVYGRLYDYKTLMQGADSTNKNPSGVQGTCPKGWHIPSDIEYALMEGLFGGSKAAGGLLKSTSSLWNSPNTGANNSTGFSGLPGGHALVGTTVTFSGIGDEANFATTTLGKSGNWTIWILSASDSFSGSTGVLQNTAVSCRCVKD